MLSEVLFHNDLFRESISELVEMKAAKEADSNASYTNSTTQTCHADLVTEAIAHALCAQ